MVAHHAALMGLADSVTEAVRQAEFSPLRSVDKPDPPDLLREVQNATLVRMRRYRRNPFELRPPAVSDEPVTRVDHIDEVAVLGIVVNPKLNKPCLVVGDENYIGIRSLAAEDPLRRIARGYLSEEYEASAEETEYPRSHTPDGVLIKGMGYGTALYTGLCLAAYLDENNYIRTFKRLRVRGQGISSSTEDRSREADAWWEASRERGLTEATGEEEYTEENVDLDVDPSTLQNCLQPDEGRIVYVNTLDVDLEKTKPGFDVYKYSDAWNNDLVVAEFAIEPNTGLLDSEPSLESLWRVILKDPDLILDVNSDALLGLDVRHLDANTISLFSLLYVWIEASDAEIDAMRYRWEHNADPGGQPAQQYLFRSNADPGDLAAVSAARAATGWSRLASLP